MQPEENKNQVSQQNPQPVQPDQNINDLKWVLPIGRSGLAIAAGYLGILGFTVILSPLALIFGILALTDIKKNPKKLGKGRAWFGVVVGVLGSAALIYFIVSAITSRQ